MFKTTLLVVALLSICATSAFAGAEAEGLDDKILIRLDDLATTIGTTVENLNGELVNEAVRTGQATLLFKLIFLIPAIIVLLSCLIYFFRSAAKPGPGEDGDKTESQIAGMVISVITAGLMVIFSGVLINSSLDSIKTMTTPQSYAMDKIGGIFK